MLVLTHEGVIPKTSIDRDGTYIWNKQRAIWAEQYLYSHIKHKELIKLALNFKGSRPTLTMEGFGPKKFAEVIVPRKWPRS